MAAYSVALNNGGVKSVLEVLEPTPVNAEEDNGAMALFMGDQGQKAETIDSNNSKQDKESNSHEEDSGADFAAQMALDMKNNQKWSQND